MSPSPNERLNFAFYLARKFPKTNLGHALELLALAGHEQKANEVACSVQLTEREQAQVDKLAKRRRARLDELREECGLYVYRQTDPRGCPLYVGPKPMSDATYQNIGLPVPGEGYTAKQLASRHGTGCL